MTEPGGKKTLPILGEMSMDEPTAHELSAMARLATVCWASRVGVDGKVPKHHVLLFMVRAVTG